MWLLQLHENGEISRSEHIGKPPPYAMLSHTWGADDEEVTFRDLVDGNGKEKEGYRNRVLWSTSSSSRSQLFLGGYLLHQECRPS
jgi:hypothetical protein